MRIPQWKGPGYRSPAPWKADCGTEEPPIGSPGEGKCSRGAFDMTISCVVNLMYSAAPATNTSGLFGRQGSSTLLRNAYSEMRVSPADSAFWISAQASVMSPC